MMVWIEDFESLTSFKALSIYTHIQILPHEHLGLVLIVRFDGDELVHLGVLDVNPVAFGAGGVRHQVKFVPGPVGTLELKRFQSQRISI